MNPFLERQTSIVPSQSFTHYRFFLNRRQLLSRALKGQIRLLELQQKHNWDRDTLLTAVVLLDDPYPFTLHFSAFIAVIEAQGTEEQIKEWIPPSEKMEILGSPRHLSY